MLLDSDDELDQQFSNFRIGSAFELVLINDGLYTNQTPPKPVNGGTIPVRKIFVHRVHPTFSIPDLTSIFEEFGRVMNVSCPRDVHTGNRRNFAFVTFFDPAGARKALNAKQSLLRQFQFVLNPADQWHQPLELPGGRIQWFRGEGHNRRSASGYPNDSEPSSCSSSTTCPGLTMMKPEDNSAVGMLNDDCLMYVFSFLTKPELIGIERVCKRWRELSLGMWMKENTLDFKKVFVMKPEICLRTDHFRELLLRCGNHISTLNISHKATELSSERTLQIISKNCKNLIYLNISNLPVQKGGMYALAKNVVGNLKALYMDSCHGLNDSNLLLLLRKAVNLEILSIAKTGVIGASLMSLPQSLKSLNVNFCFQIRNPKLSVILSHTVPNLEVLKANGSDLTAENLGQATSRFIALSLSKTKFTLRSPQTSPTFPSLQVLDLSFDTLLNDEMLKVLVENCPALEKLDVSGGGQPIYGTYVDSKVISNNGLREICKLRSLTVLNLNYLRHISSEGLEYMAANARGKLRRIELKDCRALSDSGPSRLVASWPELTSMDLSHCSDITQGFLESALTSVKLRSNKVPLSLVVGNTKITEDEAFEQHPLLNVSYKSSPMAFIGFGMQDLTDDDSDEDDIFMDELDWEAQLMLGDDLEFFEWYQHGHDGWDFERDFESPDEDDDDYYLDEYDDYDEDDDDFDAEYAIMQ